MRRTVMEAEHEAFRSAFRDFAEKEIVPFHGDWERAGIVPRAVWEKARAHGFLCMNMPEAYGGGGSEDYRFLAVISEELARAGASGVGFPMHTDIVAPYLLAYGTEQQKRRWLPAMAAGKMIAALALTEPGAGSDLAGIATTATRDGDQYVLRGQKTFVTKGINADLVLVAARTSPVPYAGLSLFLAERGAAGFTRDRNLEKIGMHAQDTAELFFDDARLPADSLLGEQDQGFRYLMEHLPQERLVVAVGSVALADAVLDQTISYCKQRTAFGQPIAALAGGSDGRPAKSRAAAPESFWSGYDLLWDEERSGAAAQRSPLDRARIIEPALRVADAEGLDAVTMRRVARELRTGAMSLYRHVPGKEGLVSLMIDKALGEDAPPGEPSGDWRNDLRMLASNMWDFIVRHPWYPQAVAERPPVTPRGLAAFEFALSILDHTGLPLSDRGAIVVSLTNTVLAAAQNAAAEARARSRFQMTDAEIESSVGTFLGEIMASGAYPRVRDVLTSADRLDPKAEMTVSVELILDGAAARIAAAT